MADDNQEIPADLQNATLERERLLSLINSMADGVIALGHTGIVQMYNGAALNILDINNIMQDKKLDDVCKILGKGKKPISITELILGTKTPLATRDYSIVYGDESVANLYLNIAPVNVGFGRNNTRGFVVIIRDITSEKSLEEERDEFISVVSHELRTPITIAEGNVSNVQFLLSKMPGNDQIKDALQAAHDQILFLSGLINDLSTLSRAESGRLEVVIEAINAHSLLENLAREYQAQIEAKGLTINVKPDSGLEILNSCPLYVREILQNFITNAIKYTEEGSVTISAQQKDRGILFEVSDSGIGISKSDQAKVFDKFFRSEDYRTRANSGTGLGLYVTMKLARKIKAEISLTSELNKGSTFSIFVPDLSKS